MQRLGGAAMYLAMVPSTTANESKSGVAAWLEFGFVLWNDQQQLPKPSNFSKRGAEAEGSSTANSRVSNS